MHSRTRSSEHIDHKNQINNDSAQSLIAPMNASARLTLQVVAQQQTQPQTLMRKSASMAEFSQEAVQAVHGLSKRGLDLPNTPRLQRRRYR
jgi:hypothetical protein